ncbi:MAG TPA: hypothetical protein PLY87_09755 [Planctomycetaceae bacterium]|nr:hypothetical protein [Planctomycetaceae bacterium]
MLKLAAMSVLEKASSQSGMQRGETKSSAVISGDGMLKWKRIGSEVANLVYERLEAPGCLIRRM